MKKIILVILPLLILSLCSCRKTLEPSLKESTDELQEQPSVTEVKETLTKEASVSSFITDKPGTKHEIRMENGDTVKITVREGWLVSDTDEKSFLVSSGDYAAIYSDSKIKVGDKDSLESLMEDFYEVPKENTGTLNINGRECFAGYKTMEDRTNLILFFQDVGVTDYVLIDITDKTGDRVEIAMSEFAIY